MKKMIISTEGKVRWCLTASTPPSIYRTRIMKSMGQRPFSSTRAIRVFWHFLPKIEYWVTLVRPLGQLNMSTGDPSCTLIFSKVVLQTLIKPTNGLLKQQNAFKYRKISKFLVHSREK